MIGLDKPCELTAWSMVAVMSYALKREFSQQVVFMYKADIRKAIKHNLPTRSVELPYIREYPATAGELDTLIRASAYGSVPPQPVIIRVDVATSAAPPPDGCYVEMRAVARLDGEVSGCGWRAVLASTNCSR